MNPRRPLHLAGYVRVSHVGGRGGESFHSPEEQARTIRDYCDRHGHRVEMLDPELDASGGSETRPILNVAVAAVEASKYDGLIVAYGSRLARDVRIMLDVCGRVEAVGGRYIDVSLDIDTATAEGRAMRTIMAAHDQMVLDQHKTRFDALKRSSTAAGVWQKRQTPKGYDRDPQTRRLVPNADAPAVRRAFEQRAGGVPVVQIAEQLEMTPSGVRRLLANRVYVGELSVRDYRNSDAHPPIVTRRMFDHVQVEQPRPARSPRRGAALLAGLIRCETCGHVMTRSGSKRVVAYRCVVHHSGFRCPRPAAIVAHRVEEYVVAVALRELEAFSVEGRTAGDALTDLQAAAEAAVAELREYVIATSAVSIGADVFAEGLAVRQAKADAAAAALRVEHDKHALTGVLIGGAEAWQRLDPSGRNTVLRAMLEAVVVATVGRGRSVPIESRVAVFPAGVGLDLPRRSDGTAAGLHALDIHDPRQLRL